jgi:hypothetical protein
MFRTPLEAVLDFFRTLLVEELKLRLGRQRRVDRTQQPGRVKMELRLGRHHAAGVRPVGANLG